MFRRETTELREELKDYQREQFDGWSRHVLAAIDHPTEPLRLANSSQGLSICQGVGQLANKIIHTQPGRSELTTKTYFLFGVADYVPSKHSHSS